MIPSRGRPPRLSSSTPRGYATDAPMSTSAATQARQQQPQAQVDFTRYQDRYPNEDERFTSLSPSSYNRQSYQQTYSDDDDEFDDDEDMDYVGGDEGPTSAMPGSAAAMVAAAQADGTKRRTRTLMTTKQLDILYALWEQTRFPNSTQREKTAELTGLTPRKVQVWFQNQRQKQNEQARRAGAQQQSSLYSATSGAHWRSETVAPAASRPSNGGATVSGSNGPYPPTSGTRVQQGHTRRSSTASEMSAGSYNNGSGAYDPYSQSVTSRYGTPTGLPPRARADTMTATSVDMPRRRHDSTPYGAGAPNLASSMRSSGQGPVLQPLSFDRNGRAYQTAQPSLGPSNIVLPPLRMDGPAVTARQSMGLPLSPSDRRALGLERSKSTMPGAYSSRPPTLEPPVHLSDHSATMTSAVSGHRSSRMSSVDAGLAFDGLNLQDRRGPAADLGRRSSLMNRSMTPGPSKSNTMRRYG